MATKKFIIEVEEGETDCSKCPFASCCSKCTIDCNYVDLATMKIKELEEQKMEGRVKATRDMIGISEDCSRLYAENYDKSYNLNELEFLNVKEKYLPKDEPDYWEKLKHQYAGMFLAGMLANSEWEGTSERLSEIAIEIAEMHINRLKEEEK